MAKKEVFVSSAYLATKQKFIEKYLLTGKIERSDFSGGFLFYLIELPARLKSSKVSKKIINLLKTVNFSDLDIEKSFESLLQSLNNSLNEIAKQGDNDWVGSLNTAIGFLKDDQIGLTQSGNVFGYIFRNGKISTIAEPLKQDGLHPLKTFVDFTLGIISANDRLVFGNAEFFDQLSLNRAREIVNQTDAKTAVFHFCSHFKKFHIYDANAIVINVDSEQPKNDEVAEMFFIDEQEESSIEKTAKALNKLFKKSILPATIKTWAFIKIYGKLLFNKYHKLFSSFIGPKISNLTQKNKNDIDSSGLKNKDSKREKSDNIKTNLYRKQDNKISGYISVLNSLVPPLIAKLKLILDQKNRKYLYASLVLIFLVISFIKLSANNDDKSGQKKEQEFILAYDQAKEKYDLVKEDIALGRAGNQTATLEDALSLSKKAELSKAKATEAKGLSKDIQTVLDSLSNANRIYTTDLSSPFNSGVKKMLLAGQDIYGIDGNGKIYSINSNDKEVRLVGSIDKENADLADLSYSENDKKIFIQTKNSKILDFDSITKTNGEASAADPGWEQGVAIANYVTNIYILDKSNGTVWKHTKKDLGYSKKTAYVSPQKADLKDAVDLAVDGNLYVLKSNGAILKFSQGLPDPFALKEIKGSNTKLSNPIKIITDADTNYIYILDSSANRIVRFNKSGDFINQYYMDGAALDDFVVNSKIQKMWLLSEGKIFEIKL